MMKLTKAEAALLLPVGSTEYVGTDEELAKDVSSTYWTFEDAPLSLRERQRAMKVLSGLASKMGVEIR